MLPYASPACPDASVTIRDCSSGTESYAQRIARIANSPAAQAVAGQAPPLTRQQTGTLRAAFAPLPLAVAA